MQVACTDRNSCGCLSSIGAVCNDAAAKPYTNPNTADIAESTSIAAGSHQEAGVICFGQLQQGCCILSSAIATAAVLLCRKQLRLLLPRCLAVSQLLLPVHSQQDRELWICPDALPRAKAMLLDSSFQRVFLCCVPHSVFSAASTAEHTQKGKLIRITAAACDLDTLLLLVPFCAARQAQQSRQPLLTAGAAASMQARTPCRSSNYLLPCFPMGKNCCYATSSGCNLR